MRVYVLAALLLAACADHAQRSVALYEAGDYAGAARAAQSGLAAHPDDDDLWAMRVRSALALGKADDVATTYAAYVRRRGSDDVQLLRDLAIATIGQALASPSARLEIRAIQTVEALEIQPLADRVADRMSDDDDRVAAAAAVAVLHGYAQAPTVARQMLHSESARARLIAVNGIGKKVGKLAAADLEAMADDPDPRVRGAALHWLGEMRDADGAPACTKHLRDPVPDVRAAAARALAQIGRGDLGALAKQALADHALVVRLAAIDLLRAAHLDRELVALGSDADPRVAIAALLAAPRKLVPYQVRARALERAAAAADWTTRAAAANQVVQALGRTAALPLARRLAGDKQIAVRIAAARVLAHAGDPADGRRVLEAALHDPDQGLQAAADLAAIGDPIGIRALSHAVLDLKHTPEQRAQAADAHLVAHRVTPGLVAALADPNGLVRIEAAATIGQLAK